MICTKWSLFIILRVIMILNNSFVLISYNIHILYIQMSKNENIEIINQILQLSARNINLQIILFTSLLKTLIVSNLLIILQWISFA